MCAYLKQNHNSEMVFDPSDPIIDEFLFNRNDWAAYEFGFSLYKELTTNLTQPLGMGFVMPAFDNANHAGDSVTCRSCTGFLKYLNCAPVYWISEKQTSIETSLFGS